MTRTFSWAFVLAALCAVSSACGSDSNASCNVTEACVAQCTEDCAPDPVNQIACRGNVCECFCRSGGGGMSGSGGAGGSGGQ